MSSPSNHVSLEITRYIAVQPLFRGINDDDLARIVDQGCSLLRVSRCRNLFSAGDLCDSLHIVITGRIKVFALAANGSEKVLELIGPGQSLGESAIFNDQRHSFSALSLSDSLLLRIPKAALVGQIGRDPNFSLRLLAQASQRIQNLLHDVESYCLHSGLQRVVGFLLKGQSDESRAPARPHTVSLPVSKATIASRLSLTPEYFSRVLRELEDEGLIQISRRDIHILQPRELDSYTLQ